jgi:octaprenyl-diphosphate synthase
MCGLKTGCLARFAAVLGVLTAPGGDRNGEAAERLGIAAEKLGVGFQILDDVKNLRTGLPGKRRGDDVVEGKKSLPVLLYLRARTRGGEEARRALVNRCFSGARAGGAAAPEVEELIAALEAEGALEGALEQGQTLIREAAETFAAPSVAGLRLEGEGRRLLAGLIGLIS